MRTFVAIEIPDTLTRELAALINALQSKIDRRAVRWVRPEAVHLTLKFLGEVAQESVPGICSAMTQVAAQSASFAFDVKGLGCFPGVRRPRVIWLGVHESSGKLLRLQRELERQLGMLGFEAERRRYHPHLTMGRVKRDSGRSAMDQLSEVLTQENIGSLGTVEVKGASLMRSELRPAGAVYTRLHFAPLEVSA